VKLVIAILLLGTSAYAQEAGVLMSGTFLKEIGTRDVGAGTSAVGLGGRFVYPIFRHVDFDADVIIWPNNQASAGTWVQGLVGAKVGQRFERMGVFVKVRPGFMHFRKDPFGQAGSGGGSILGGRNFAHTTDPIIDVGGVVEYYTARGLILRFDLGDTMISYGRRTVFISQFQPPLDRGGFRTDNWQGSFGVSLRF
jgi:hypothetical protein